MAPTSSATAPSFLPGASRPFSTTPVPERLPRLLRDLFATVLTLCRSRIGLLAALAMNALWMPYLGFEHDASLYAVQASQRAFEGQFSNDLFLKFGSQDRFSGFSVFMAPLVKTLGVETAFFTVFLIAQTTLFAAIWSLFRMLFPRPGLVGLAMLMVAVVPLRYGGFGTFAINESFLTARTIAYAFSIFALSHLAQARFIAAALMAVAALWMHPIIAFPILATLVFCVAQRMFTPKALLALMALAFAAFVTTLVVPSLGFELYGRMDALWLNVIRDVQPYCFPEMWPVVDWERLLFVMLLGLAGAQAAEQRYFPMYAGLLIVGITGLLLSLAAGQLPYALPIQAQAYRYAWPLYLLAIPLGIQTVWRTWRSPSFWLRLAGAALFVYMFFAGDPVWRPIAWLLCLVAILAKVATGRMQRWHFGVMVAVMLAAGALYSGFLTTRTLWEAARIDTFLCGANIWRRDLHVAAGCALSLGGTLLLLWGLSRICTSRWTFRVVCFTTFVGLQLLTVGLLHAPWCGPYGAERFADVAFVKNTLDSELGPSQTLVANSAEPTIHWPTRNPWETWFEVGACSYFTVNQTAGALFDRETAMETRRRAHLTSNFDVPYLSEHFPIALSKRTLFDIYDVKDRTQLPNGSLGDLLQLCADNELDFAVLPIKFDDWAIANNGRWYIYDCRQIRNTLVAMYRRMDAKGTFER